MVAEQALWKVYMWPAKEIKLPHDKFTKNNEQNQFICFMHLKVPLKETHANRY